MMDIKFLKYENEHKNQEMMKNLDKERQLQNKKAKVLNNLEERKMDDYRQDFEKVVDEIKYTENVDKAEFKDMRDKY